MKITIEKGMPFKWVLYLLNDLKNRLLEQNEDREDSILKDTMTIDFQLENYLWWPDTFEDDSINDEVYNIDFRTIEKYENEAKRLADIELEVTWEWYINNCNCDSIKNIVQKDFNHLKSAIEKNMKPITIEKREIRLKQHEKELEIEQYIIKNIDKFNELKLNDKVIYQYREVTVAEFKKEMIFEQDNKKFIFYGDYYDKYDICGYLTQIDEEIPKQV